MKGNKIVPILIFIILFCYYLAGGEITSETYKDTYKIDTENQDTNFNNNPNNIEFINLSEHDIIITNYNNNDRYLIKKRENFEVKLDAGNYDLEAKYIYSFFNRNVGEDDIPVEVGEKTRITLTKTKLENIDIWINNLFN